MGTRVIHWFRLAALLVMFAWGCTNRDSLPEPDADAGLSEVPEAIADLAGDPPADAVDIFADPQERPPDCTDEHPQNLSPVQVSLHAGGPPEEVLAETSIVSGLWRGARSEGDGTVVSIERSDGSVIEILVDIPVGDLPSITDSSPIRFALFPGPRYTIGSLESALNLIVMDEGETVLHFALLGCVTLDNPIDIGNISVRREPRPICLMHEYMDCKHYGRNHIVVGSGGPESWIEPGTTFDLSAGPRIYDVSHRLARDRYWGEFGGEDHWEWCADEEADFFSFSVVMR